ncbi:VPS35A [Symbiodinium pilosum]|uniref:VPS35A protein n=1 Tax=Symbiodinium pilosum TaxID=2952 RepID=A0A812NNW3_SYMPI|nr:VPS35A [Symbiodinium pilosum]
MPIIKEDRLQQYDVSAFRFDKMKEEVADAMKEDWKRDTIDDAKKRAITTTSSYDEFRSRVAGCHLKPIHKNEFNAPPKFAFNRQVERSKVVPGTNALSTTVLNKAARCGGQTEIRSIRELDKELRRRRTAEDKADLVIQMSSETVQRVFSREMDAEVFQQLLEALEQADRSTVPQGTATRFLDDLASLCPSSTSQASAFFSPEERGLITRLLARDEAQPHDPSIVRLCASWGITPSSLSAATLQAPASQASRAAVPDGVHQDVKENYESMVFPDTYHLHTLEKVLATCAQVHWSIDLVHLMQNLLRRLTVHLVEGGGVASSSSSVDVFVLFHVHLKQLHGRPRTAATPLISLLTLQLELCMFVLALQPGEGCLEILEGTVSLLSNSGETGDSVEHLDTQLAQAVVDLMAAPLTKEGLCSSVLNMPYHSSLLAMLSPAMQGRAAMAMVTAILAGDVSLQNCETLRQLFALMGTLLRDETGQDGRDDRPRHLEHDPIAFRREQETVAQLIHQVRHEDPAVLIDMLFVLWEYFQEGGPHRIIFTVPAMVTAVLQLADRLTSQGRNREHECSQLSRMFDFTHSLCQSLGTLVPKESFRLWLLCAASADRAAAAKTCPRLTELGSRCVDRALACLEEQILKQEARLCGLQLLVGTLQQMKLGPEEPVKIRQRAVALCSKMLSKSFQSKAFCLCCELFWLPQPELQDADGGLLCLRRALQSADGAIHSDPSDVGLFVDILNKVARLFAKGAGEVTYLEVDLRPAEQLQCKATLASQMLSQLLTARSIAIIFVEQDGQQYGALFANLSLVAKSAFVFSPENFQKPSLAKGLHIREIRPEVASDTSLAGLGRLVHHPEEFTVGARTFEITRWPQPGWRPLDPGTGDEAGTTEGDFEVKWQGDYFHGHNLAIATENNKYLDGLGAMPEEAVADKPADAGAIYLWMSDYHPDGGQLFWPRTPVPFTVCLGPASIGDDIKPEDMRAFHVPRGKGIYIHPGTWHNGIYVAPRHASSPVRFLTRQGRVHARISVSWAAEFGTLLKVPLE